MKTALIGYIAHSNSSYDTPPKLEVLSTTEKDGLRLYLDSCMIIC